MSDAAAPRRMSALLLDPDPSVRLSAAALCEAFSRARDGTAAALSDPEAHFVPRLVESIEAEGGNDAAATPARAAALRALGNVAGFAGGLSAVLAAGHAPRAALHALEHCHPEADAALMVRVCAGRETNQIQSNPPSSLLIYAQQIPCETAASLSKGSRGAWRGRRERSSRHPPSPPPRCAPAGGGGAAAAAGGGA